MDVPMQKKGDEGRTVVAAYLLESSSSTSSKDVSDGVTTTPSQMGKKQLARYVNWPEPLKYLHLQKPKELKAELSGDGKSVALSAEVPVKGVAVESEDDAVRFEDNLVDIVPGETVWIPVRGASEGTVVTTRYLGMI